VRGEICEANSAARFSKVWDRLGQGCGLGQLEVIENLVELTGIEPVASSLRTRRSPS
jgi:hypothetical protein